MTVQKTAEQWVSLARDAFSGSTTYFDASIRPTIEANLRQFQGVHPAGSKYHADAYRARSRLFRPKTRAVIRKNEAIAAEAFFSSNDVVTVKTVNQSDPRYRAAAEIHQSLLQYRLENSIPWFLTAIGAYQESQVNGVVASYQSWLYKEKRRKSVDKPNVELLPVENLRIDPAASWVDPINTSPYVIHLMPMYVKDVKAKMRAGDPGSGQPKWFHMDDAMLLQATKSYGDSTRQTRERGRTDSKEQATAITDFTIVWVHKNIIEVDGEDYLFYTLGDQKLLSEPVPLEDVYLHGVRPYVIGQAIIEVHKVYSASVAEITRDLQTEINELANLRIDNVRFALNKRYTVKRSRQVDLRSLTRNVPGSATMVTDHDDVKVMETNDVTGSSYQEQDRLNLDFDDVSGSFSQSSVQSNRNLNETVGGMNILTSNSNQVSGYQLRTFVETWVEPVLRQLILLEAYYETDEVILKLAAEAAQLLQKYSINELDDDLLMIGEELSVKVNVGIGATNPLDQINQFLAGMRAIKELLADGALEKYGLEVEEVIKEIFGKLGYKDGGRFFDMENEDPRITAMKATIQQLQAELATKVNPELVAAQVRKLDAEIDKIMASVKDIDAGKLEKNLRSIFSAMQAAEKIATTPQIAPIADELMTAGGYQNPNPAGVDPNFPTLGAPASPASATAPAASMVPPGGMPGVELDGGAPGDTSPNTPAGPASPATGANQGIETTEND